MRVALCICTAGRPAGLARLLDHLARVAEVPPAIALALVVVDNRPQRSVEDTVAQVAARAPWPVTYVAEPRPGIPFARNTAVRAAIALGAELVAFLDDDDLPEAGWLRALLDCRARTGAAVVFGTAQYAEPDRLPGWARHLRYFAPATLERLNPFGIPVRAGAGNVLLDGELLRRLAETGPLFRPEFARTGGEDTDLFIRARDAGASLAVARESVIHLGCDLERLTFAAVLRRGLALGATRFQLHLAHGERVSPARRRRRAWRRLRRSLWRMLPEALEPTRRHDAMVRVAEDAGELMAAFGRGWDYYGRAR